MVQEPIGLTLGRAWSPEVMEMNPPSSLSISTSSKLMEFEIIIDPFLKTLSVIGDYSAIIAVVVMWITLREHRRQLTQDRKFHREQMEDINQKHEQQMRIIENDARTKILRKKLIAAANNISYYCYNKSSKGMFRCRFVNSLGNPGLVCYVMWSISYSDRRGHENYTFDVYFSFLSNIDHNELIDILMNPLNWIYKATIIRRAHGYGETIHGKNLKHSNRKYILDMHSNEFSTISNALGAMQALDEQEVASHRDLAAKIGIPVSSDSNMSSSLT